MTFMVANYELVEFIALMQCNVLVDKFTNVFYKHQYTLTFLANKENKYIWLHFCFLFKKVLTSEFYDLHTVLDPGGATGAPPP